MILLKYITMHAAWGPWSNIHFQARASCAMVVQQDGFVVASWYQLGKKKIWQSGRVLTCYCMIVHAFGSKVYLESK